MTWWSCDPLVCVSATTLWRFQLSQLISLGLYSWRGQQLQKWHTEPPVPDIKKCFISCSGWCAFIWWLWLVDGALQLRGRPHVPCLKELTTVSFSWVGGAKQPETNQRQQCHNQTLNCRDLLAYLRGVYEWGVMDCCWQRKSFSNLLVEQQTKKSYIFGATVVESSVLEWCRGTDWAHFYTFSEAQWQRIWALCFFLFWTNVMKNWKRPKQITDEDECALHLQLLRANKIFWESRCWSGSPPEI